MNFTVLYEDNHLIAVKKLSGEIVQSDKTGDVTLADNVKSYIKKKYKKPGDVFLGIIHRLDRPVAGVIIFARTSSHFLVFFSEFLVTCSKHYQKLTKIPNYNISLEYSSKDKKSY